ncbi:MAG: hypothetical protein QF416_01510, partial [Candidatus Marinimicrobia bacterium]|nr:hypothetical protein [Candidatus Neomarinimicrobiota bacterium]
RKEDTQEYATYLMYYVEEDSVERELFKISKGRSMFKISKGRSKKSVKESWDYLEELANDLDVF